MANQMTVKMKIQKSFCIVVSLGVLALAACTRSPEYKHDQEFYQANGYYGQPPAAGNGPAGPQKVESMGQPKKRVVIFDFYNDTPVRNDSVGPFAAQEIKRLLYATQRVIISDELKTELATKDFVQGDDIKVAQLIREGRRLGVSVVVIGRISRITSRMKGDDIGVLRQKQAMTAVDVEAKVFDILSGREVTAMHQSGEASSNNVVATEDSNINSPEYRAELAKFATRDAVNRMISPIVQSIEKMAWQGSIVKMIGNKIYLNAGRHSGLVAGDVLRVLTQGEDIYDPKSGAFLGRTQGQLKGTIEVVDFIGTDGAVGQLHTGGNFQEGDLVRLY